VHKDTNKNRHLKKVISASRRVDLVTFYPDYTADRIKEIGAENVHTLVIWTKNPNNILSHPRLKNCLEELDQIYILLTVTGLGGTPLEPFAPDSKEVFDQLPKIIDFIGSPQRLAIRYDPLIDVVYKGKLHLSNIDTSLFDKILEKTSPLGIKRIIVSYVTLYNKVVERLKRNEFEIVDHNIEEITDFIKNKMMPRLKNLNMELSTCVLPHLTTKGCIDGSTLTLLHPKKELCSKAKDQSQRQTCHCTNSYDIGKWFSCYHNCLYCYGNPKSS
jgi:DNA repair photolyase